IIAFIITTTLYKNKIDNQYFKVYSFNGENKDIRISNGIIIVYPNKQIVSGGEILYTGSKNENIQSYSKKIYINEEGNNDNVVLSNSVSLQNDNKGIVFPDEFLLNKGVGEISSEKLFSEDLNIIKDNFYFCLDYSKVNGEKGNFIIKLNVNEVKI
ncbi:hypothetical protein, partial [Clostridium butyricum]|uniref:hypothetical protein n=1 Tax=Clostridium butyricum TaxID=1492 RepID=UPI00374E28E2